MLEGGAFEKLHHDKGLAVLLADIVNGADVGVVQCGGGLRFTPEASQGLGIVGHLVRQKLQGDKAEQARVLGLVDHAHPTAAELPDNRGSARWFGRS